MTNKLLLLFFLFHFFQSKSQIITTVAGNGISFGYVDSVQATTTSLYSPTGIAVDASGNLFIADGNTIEEVYTSGIIVTIAGSTGGYSGDGGPAILSHMEPTSITLDVMGNIYISDWSNSVIRKIDTAGIINTVAGNGIDGFSGDNGPAISAQLHGPNGVAVDKYGNLYIADTDNHRVRKVNTAGIITTIAGSSNYGFSGDGGHATSASMKNPTGVTLDEIGNLYITDFENDRIRKVDTSGIISTIAGTGIRGYNGDGILATSAELSQPSGIAVDSIGNVFFADVFNSRIRMINTLGIISTVAGNGPIGYGGDGGPATAAGFVEPWGITLDGFGNLFIADVGNYRIRKVSNIINNDQQINKKNYVSIFPNPSNGKFNIETNTVEEKIVQVFDLAGKLVLKKILKDKTAIDATFLNEGIYNLTIISGHGVINKKLVLVK